MFNQFGAITTKTTKNDLEMAKIFKNYPKRPKTTIFILYTLINALYVLSFSGDVYAFGDNSFGQCGIDKDQIETILDPRRISTLTRQGIRKIIPGLMHCAAQTKNGRVWIWGSNKFGQLGHGKASDYFEPPRLIQELLGESVNTVALGDKHTVCLLEKRGAVYTFGCNGFGQLGSGESRDIVVSPVKIFEDVNCQIFAGSGRTFIASKSGAKFLVNRSTKKIKCITEVDEDYHESIEMTRISGLRENYQSEKLLLAYTSVINASFLSESHEQTNTKNTSGIDFDQLFAAFESWSGTEYESHDLNSLSIISEKLLPSLRPQPPSIETIRVYLVLPLLPHFKLPYEHIRILSSLQKTVNSIHSQFCFTFNRLDKNAKKVLHNWLINEVPLKILKIFVNRLMEVVCFILECLEFRTPELSDHPEFSGINSSSEHPRFLNEYQLMQLYTSNFIQKGSSREKSIEMATEKLDNLRMNNQTIFEACKTLDFLNYVNNQRKEKLKKEEFYLQSYTGIAKIASIHSVSNYPLYNHPNHNKQDPYFHVLEEFIRRLVERNDFPTFSRKMDTQNWSFSKRSKFVHPSFSNSDYDEFFDYYSKSVEYFNLCQFPFTLDPKSKANLLKYESQVTQTSASQNARHRLRHMMFYEANIQTIIENQPILSMTVSRDNLIESTIQNLIRVYQVNPGDLKKPLTVSFHGEQARDAQANETAGVRREFFLLILEAFLSPTYRVVSQKCYKNGQSAIKSRCLTLR